MSLQSGPRRPRHLWIVAVLSLLWNAMGAFDYVATKLRLEFYMQNFTPEQLDYFYGFPAAMTAFWAFGVWGALLGSVALLLASRWAVALFAISLLGMLVSMSWSFLLNNGVEIMGSAGSLFSLVILLIGIGLLFYARQMRKAGVLR